MQIYHNVLSQELIQDCWKEVEYLSKQKVWSSSSTTWGEGTMQGVTGSTLITKVPTTTENKIIECISKYYPNDTEYIIQYFIWQNNSGIAFHSDGNYRSGATIYLARLCHAVSATHSSWSQGNMLVTNNVLFWRNVREI